MNILLSLTLKGLIAVIFLVSACSQGGGGGGKKNFTPSSSHNVPNRFVDASQTKNSMDTSELVDRFLGLVAEISARQKSLERERDRRGKLQLELLGLGSGGGCMQGMPIDKVELIIDGDHLLPLDVSQQYEKTTGLTAPKDEMELNFEFTLGRNGKRVVYLNDEKKEPLFASGIRKIIPIEDKDFTLGDLQYIQIKKPEHYHQTTSICAGQILSQCEQTYGVTKKVEEKERFVLRALKIKVNTELVYERENIDFGFVANSKASESIKEKGLVWKDTNIMLNEAFIRLMQVEQCSF